MSGNALRSTLASRKAILFRLLYTLVCLLAFEIVKILVQLTVLVQYVLLLAVKGHSEALRCWSNGLSAYGYRLMRYLTLVENAPPFPFAGFPDRIENSVEQVSFSEDRQGKP